MLLTRGSERYRYLESKWNEEECDHTEIRTGGTQEATITCSLTLRCSSSELELALSPKFEVQALANRVSHDSSALPFMAISMPSVLSPTVHKTSASSAALHSDPSTGNQSSLHLFSTPCLAANSFVLFRIAGYSGTKSSRRVLRHSF